MYIECVKHWIPISKEEYEENYPEITENDDALEALKKFFCKSLNFYKKCIYRESGINSIINDDIIGYKYYKLDKEEPVCIYSQKEYENIVNLISENGYV